MAGWQDPENFAIGLFVALLIVIFLVTSIVVLTRLYFNRIIQEQEKLTQAKIDHQQSLLWNSILIQEKERERIAADLHDGLISKLTVLMYALRTNNSQISPAELLDDSIKIAREITHDLSPPLLNQTSIQELIESFISPLSEAYTIDSYYGCFCDYELKNEIKLQLLRIVQEIINNILKHAKATRIIVRLKVAHNSIGLVIRDNGIGFDTTQDEHGLGMKNIELRSQLLNGKWRFKSTPNIGTVFQFYSTNNDHFLLK
jgi:two-component system NarL family sensor kinase